MEAMKASADSAAGAAADSSSTMRPATADQRREWRATRRSLHDASVAAKRGRDGPISHLIEQQPLHWGAYKGAPPKPQAYVCRTRVLKVGNSRVTVFDGERPNSPRKGDAPRVYDPDAF